MARKSIKGYAEKNYYDVTRFSGGVVATNDPLNEGYFKHLVNFDISDTGQSLTPRKGFITTMFKKGDYWAPSDECVYFYDESLGKYIFYECVNIGSGEGKAYIVDFDSPSDYLSDIQPISTIDISDINRIDGHQYYDVHPISTNKAIRVKDEYNITCYIIKAKCKFPSNIYKQLYLKMYYNKKDDTLVVSYLDTNQIVNYVDTNYRNLASNKSVIPNPMQEVYPKDNIPVGHYDQFPMIYVQNDDGKYLINNIKDITSFKVIPNFYLAEDEREDYTWGYTYEIYSTNKDLKYNDDTIVYKAPIYNLSTNEIIYGTDTISTHLKHMYELAWGSLLSEDATINIINLYDSTYQVTLDKYKTYISDISSASLPPVITPEYVIYLVPLAEPTNTYEINLSASKYLGPRGLLTHFDNTRVIGKYTPPASGGTLPEVEYIEFAWASFHNERVRDGTLLSTKYTVRNNTFDILGSITDFNSFMSFLENNKDSWGVYVKNLNDIKCNFLSEDEGYVQDCVETVLLSSIYTWEDSPLTYDKFITSEEYVTISKNVGAISLKVLPYRSKVKCIFPMRPDVVPAIYYRLFKNFTNDVEYTLAFNPKVLNESSASAPILYDTPEVVPYTITDRLDLERINAIRAEYVSNKSKVLYSLFFGDYTYYGDATGIVDTLMQYPVLYYENTFTKIIKNPDAHLFSRINDKLIGNFNITHTLYKWLQENHFFDEGLVLNFYLLKMPTDDHMDIIKHPSRDNIFLQSRKIQNSRTLTLVQNLNDVTYYVETLEEDPELIKNAEGVIKYDSMLGSHLVLYTGNKLFISKEGMQYYFFNYNTFDFPEEIVKVIQYKEILLVFTTQDLYAVYLEEVTTEVANGYNEDGSIKYIQQKSYEFRSQVVLYNLMVDKRYIDAIQVYNQMVLFYSSDGQMFLIKPTAAITSDTRFSIQYFNKSANDILLNYKDYMQRRLQNYGIDDTIKDVDIKVSATLNYIKVFYNAPGLITYILVYDVINNRYYVYDTMSFTNIKYIHHTSIGELYITEHDNKFYFTLPYNNVYEVDNNVDVNCHDYFNPYPIISEIDTGTINLNNHLKKRFKDLHVIYKNLNANSVEFAVESFIDDIPIIPYVSTSFEIKTIDGAITVVENNKVEELIDHTALLSFIDYTSNKIITHRTNIISRGKTIRIKMNFKSKGKYKIQGFGLIYKEHTV